MKKNGTAIKIHNCLYKKDGFDIRPRILEKLNNTLGLHSKKPRFNFTQISSIFSFKTKPQSKLFDHLKKGKKY